jgi:hypothetical protein
MWDAVVAFEEETGLVYDMEDRKLAEELYTIVQDIERGDLDRAIQYVLLKFVGSKANDRWCDANKEFLQSPPHPSSLPFYLHRTIFSNLPAKDAILYARQYLMSFMPSHQVLPLLTSALYQDRQIPHGTQAAEGGSLVALFREEFCRRHGWPKEDPLEVIVDLGSRGGALNAVEKARKLIGERLGQDARTWDELPVCPLSSSHSRIRAVILTNRWRSRCRPRDDITRYSYAQYRKNRPQNRIPQRCCHVVIPSHLSL